MTYVVWSWFSDILVTRAVTQIRTAPAQYVRVHRTLRPHRIVRPRWRAHGKHGKLPPGRQVNAETINFVDTVQARHSASCMVMRGAIKIAVAEARIDDPSAMASFLAPIPNNGELAALLAKREPLNTRAYDDETQTARFVISDGNIAICFAVTDITIDQAELITIACEESNEWGAASFPEAASRALGEPVERVQ